VQAGYRRMARPRRLRRSTADCVECPTPRLKAGSIATVVFALAIVFVF